MTELTIQIADEARKKAMVVSHERSGTHFLMNTLAQNFGYSVKPWINFDFSLGINFHSTNALRAFFGQMAGEPVLNIVKSHHAFEFFEPIIGELLDEYHLFYIYRDPRDVMASFWRVVNHLEWDFGPKFATVGEFMRAPPRAASLRYQKRQAETMLDRWRAHVEGWTHCAEEHEGLIVVRYEDLNTNFEATLDDIGERIAMPCANPTRPAVDENVVQPGKGEIGSHRALFTADDYAFVEDVTVGVCDALISAIEAPAG